MPSKYSSVTGATVALWVLNRSPYAVHLCAGVCQDAGRGTLVTNRSHRFRDHHTQRDELVHEKQLRHTGVFRARGCRKQDRGPRKRHRFVP